MGKLRVAVLCGGRSAEHEISLLSARFVVAALDPDKFEPVLVGIEKTGRWSLQDAAILLSASRDPRVVRLDAGRPGVALRPEPAPNGQATLAIEGGATILIDAVFPVLHGPMGEDGTIQGLFELAGVPFVGASVLGASVGMDKDVMKRLLREAELPIVPHVTIRRRDWDRDRQGAIALAIDLGFPSFVKPANLGSSVGVSRARSTAELERAIDEAFRYDEKAVVERGVPGVREIECAVLGDDEPQASVVGEIVVDHPDGFYSYAAKYLDEKGSSTRIPADLTRAQASAVELLALKTFGVLSCSGLARVDFFLSSEGELFVNEINTLPGFTAISMYPKLWEASGVAPRELVTRLLDFALVRGARRRALATNVTP